MVSHNPNEMGDDVSVLNSFNTNLQGGGGAGVGSGQNGGLVGYVDTQSREERYA